MAFKKSTNFFLPIKFLGIVFIVFFIIVVFTLLRRPSVNSDSSIHQDIQKLQLIIQDIQYHCYIYNFLHDKNYIDFLNIKDFVGSQVGSMQLNFPQNWKGPYLHENLKVQNILYMILKNKQGYFIVPGDGVQLSNGIVIGKDLILDKNSNMKSLINDSKYLGSDSGVLAAEIKIGTNFIKTMLNGNVELLNAMD